MERGVMTAELRDVVSYSLLQKKLYLMPTALAEREESELSGDPNI